MNALTISGHLGRDPEARETKSGKMVCETSLAIKQMGDETTWVRLVVWGQPGKFLAEYGRKGSFVVASGRLGVDEWTDKDGGKRTTVQCVAFNVELPMGDQQKTDGHRSEKQIEREANAKKPQFSDDEIPF